MRAGGDPSIKPGVLGGPKGPGQEAVPLCPEGKSGASEGSVPCTKDSFALTRWGAKKPDAAKLPDASRLLSKLPKQEAKQREAARKVAAFLQKKATLEKNYDVAMRDLGQAGQIFAAFGFRKEALACQRQMQAKAELSGKKADLAYFRGLTAVDHNDPAEAERQLAELPKDYAGREILARFVGAHRMQLTFAAAHALAETTVKLTNETDKSFLAKILPGTGDYSLARDALRALMPEWRKRLESGAFTSTRAILEDIWKTNESARRGIAIIGGDPWNGTEAETRYAATDPMPLYGLGRHVDLGMLLREEESPDPTGLMIRLGEVCEQGRDEGKAQVAAVARIYQESSKHKAAMKGLLDTEFFHRTDEVIVRDALKGFTDPQNALIMIGSFGIARLATALAMARFAPVGINGLSLASRIGFQAAEVVIESGAFTISQRALTQVFTTKEVKWSPEEIAKDWASLAMTFGFLRFAHLPLRGVRQEMAATRRFGAPDAKPVQVNGIDLPALNRGGELAFKAFDNIAQTAAFYTGGKVSHAINLKDAPPHFFEEWLNLLQFQAGTKLANHATRGWVDRKGFELRSKPILDAAKQIAEAHLGKTPEAEQYAQTIYLAHIRGEITRGELSRIAKEAVADRSVARTPEQRQAFIEAMQHESQLPERNEGLRWRRIETLWRTMDRLVPADRLRFALAIEQNLWDHHEILKWKTSEVLVAIAEGLPAADRFALALAVERRLTDKSPQVRKAACSTMGNIASRLNPVQSLRFVLAIEQRLKDEDADVRISAIVLLGSILEHVPVSARLRLVLAVEQRFEDVDVCVRINAMHSVAVMMKDLASADRLPRAMAIEQRLSDDHDRVRTKAGEMLSFIAGDLSPADRLRLVSAVEQRLGDGHVEHRDNAARALRGVIAELSSAARLSHALAIEPGLRDGDAQVRGRTVESLRVVAEFLEPAGRLTLLTQLTRRNDLGNLEGKLVGAVIMKIFRATRFVPQPVESVEYRMDVREMREKAAKTGDRVLNRVADFHESGLPFDSPFWPQFVKAREPQAFLRQVGQAYAALQKNLTDYNRLGVLDLFRSETSQQALADLRTDQFMDHVELYAEVFRQWPRLGYNVLEGMLEARRSGIMPPDIASQKSRILTFIERTNGFVPKLYEQYLAKGDAYLDALAGDAARMVRDELGSADVQRVMQEHGEETLLGLIQMASPTSGASFVKRSEQLGLLKKMIEAGDLRRHIPEAWRKRLESFDLRQGDWMPKDGAVADADGQVRALLDRFRAEENAKAPAANALPDAIRDWLKSDRDPEKRLVVQEALYRLAAREDVLKEKIDRIHGVDYTTILLLEQLFADKDQLRKMLVDAIKKLPPEALAGKGERKNAIRNANDIAKGVKKIWAAGKSREERIAMLGRMLKLYKVKEIEAKLLARGDMDADLRDAIRLVSQDTPALQTHQIIGELLVEPIQMIQGEKAKYEYRDTGSWTVGLRAVKGPAFGLNGLTSGVCTATDIELWKKPEFKLFAITATDGTAAGQKGDGATQVVGYIHVFETTINGKKYITLPGINPSAEFLGSVDAQKLYEGLMEKVIAFAEAGGYEGVYIPTNKNIHSNRSDIQKAIGKSGYRIKTIPEVHWNTTPAPYPFTEVFVAWER